MAAPLCTFRTAPALAFFPALASGIALAHERIIPEPWWPGLLLAALMLFLVAAYRERRRLVTLSPLGYAIGFLLAGMALGGWRYTSARLPASGNLIHLASLEDHPSLLLGGRVLAVWKSTSYQHRVVIAAETLHAGDTTLQVRGLVLAYLPRDRMDRPLEHARVSLEGRLFPLPRTRVPGNFDYGAYLFHRGIQATFHVTRLRAMHAGTRPPLDRLRQRLRDLINRHVWLPDVRSLFEALLLGDRRAMDAETVEAFRKTGLAHLLAISGLHLLLLGFACYRLLRVLLLRMKLSWHAVEILRTLLTLLLLLGYVLLSGRSPSAMRALLMGSVFMLGPCFRRNVHPLQAFGLAGTLMLLLNPHVLFHLGFQLSFTAVVALLVFPALIPLPGGPRWLRYPAESLKASVYVLLGTLPVLLYHFGEVYLGALFLNILCIPLLALLLLAILPFAITGILWPAGAALLAHPATLFGYLLLMLVRHGEHLLASLNLQVAPQDVSLLLLLVAGLLLLILRPLPRLLRTGAGVLILSGFLLRQLPDAHLQVYMLDVGQGDAAVIRLPSGSAYLFDAGPPVDPSSSTCGAWLPFLRWAKIRQVEAVILSHPHADHFGALPCLLGRIPIKGILTNGQSSSFPLYRQMQQRADTLQIPIQTVLAGARLPMEDARGYVLHPAAIPDSTADANHHSLVLLLAYGHTRWLFTGDIDAPAEHTLLRRYGDFLRADAVKIPHHGSATGSSPTFVRRVVREGTIAFAGVGTRNRYGLPRKEVLQRWQEAGARVYTTAREGTLWLQSDGDRVRLISWRSARDKHGYGRIPDQ